MESTPLVVRRRTENGSAAARRLRAHGRVPGVVYGKKSETVSVSVDAVEMRRILRHGHNVLLELNYDEAGEHGAKQYAVINEIQRDALRPVILNIDFQHVDLSDEMEARIPVELVGEAEGVRSGGILEQLVHEVDVRALPEKMPTSLQLDISAMEVGDQIKAAALAASADYEVLSDPTEIIVMLSAPRLVEAETAEAEAEAGPEATEAE